MCPYVRLSLCLFVCVWPLVTVLVRVRVAVGLIVGKNERARLNCASFLTVDLMEYYFYYCSGGPPVLVKSVGVGVGIV